MTTPALPNKSKDKSKLLENVQSWIQLAQLRFEKCELKEAHVAFTMALQQAKKTDDLRAIMESLSGLLRLCAESLDEPSIQKWDKELQELMLAHPDQIPPTAFYCKAVLARYQKNFMGAQRYAHEYICAVERDVKTGHKSFGMSSEEALARGWSLVATIFYQRGKIRRAEWLANHLVEHYQNTDARTVVGIACMVLANLNFRLRKYDKSMEFYQKAHVSFLSEHNWYYHLYTLLGYASIHRHQQNFTQAQWYLNLVDKAAPGAEFGVLRREMAIERAYLQQDSVDIVIDSRKGVIKTRESGQISLRKQYVLLHILEALSKAHSHDGADIERGLSKAEIIERVWEVPYRPEAHDNKLYYNINRLRKLIEPDIRQPQYLLNWKEGYRLAPGLKIQLLGGGQSVKKGEMV